jgi:hypothetical protein
METTRVRIGSTIKRWLVYLLRPFRRVLGRMLQVVEKDELRSLRHETARLSSASVESVTYLGAEMRNLDERLAKLEQEIGELRRLISEQGGETSSQVARAESSATPSA